MVHCTWKIVSVQTMSQLCGKSIELIKELKRTENQEFLSPYNENMVKQILAETDWWFNENRKDVSKMYSEAGSNQGLFAGRLLSVTPQIKPPSPKFLIVNFLENFRLA